MNGSWNPKGSSSCVAETGSLQAQELSKSRRNRSGLPHSKELAWCTNPWARSLEGSGWGSPSGGLGAGPEQGQCLGDEPRGGWETRAVLEEAQGTGGWGGGALTAILKEQPSVDLLINYKRKRHLLIRTQRTRSP